MSATPDDVHALGDTEQLSDVTTDHVTSENPEALKDDNTEVVAEPANTTISTEDLPDNPVEAETGSTVENFDSQAEQIQESISESDSPAEESLVNPEQQLNLESTGPEPAIAVDSGTPNVDEPVGSEPDHESVAEAVSEKASFESSPEAGVAEPATEEPDQVEEQPDQPEEAMAEVDMAPEGEEEASNEATGSVLAPDEDGEQDGLASDSQPSGVVPMEEDAEEKSQEAQVEKVTSLEETKELEADKTSSLNDDTEMECDPVGKSVEQSEPNAEILTEQDVESEVEKDNNGKAAETDEPALAILAVSGNVDIDMAEEAETIPKDVEGAAENVVEESSKDNKETAENDIEMTKKDAESSKNEEKTDVHSPKTIDETPKDDVETSKDDDKTSKDDKTPKDDYTPPKNSADTNVNGGGLKIASVSSRTVENDDCVQVMDEDKEKDTAAAKKPMLKLASFADLGQNGISDSTPMSADDCNQCGQCSKKVEGFSNSLMWEAMIFCNVGCLSEYQLKLSNCSTCKAPVLDTSLGKYCVRFGSNIKQFCSNVCLEDHKKGLKVCFYCQKDISGGDGFLAPIGDKGQFKDFCVPECLQKYEAAHCGKPIEKETAACAVCSQEKTVEVYLLLSLEKSIKLCSPPCLSAYKFGNNVNSTPCNLCSKEMDTKEYPLRVVHSNGKSKTFCTQTCYNVFIFQNREIVLCTWCKVKKYNFDMMEKLTGDPNNSSIYFCSVNCFTANSKKGSMAIQQVGQWNGGMQSGSMPVIQSVSSLAGTGEVPARPDRLPTEPVPQAQIQQQVQIQTQTITQTQTIKETLVKHPDAVEMKNKATMAKPFMHTRGVSCRPHPCHKSTQTEGPSLPVIVPVAVPFYMPVPTVMYQKPYPVPVPFPIPIPVPVFIPTTRNSARGIMKQIKKIRAKLPADPFEAELLAMAGALVDRDKTGTGMSDYDSDDSVDDGGWDDYDGGTQNVHMNAMRNAPDLECDIKADRVIPKPLPQVTQDISESPQPFGYNRGGVQASPAAAMMGGRQQQQMQQMRGQGSKRRYSSRDGEEEEDENSPWKRQQDWRSKSSNRGRSSGGGGRSKQARTDNSSIMAVMNKPPEERPDAKHHLKFTYGVNAWKHWVVGKNAELEKARAQGRYMKPFETDILKLRADELNYTLCMFVKEVKKPNGDAYAPDSILYLTLGIQEYLFENGRIDNIFMDTYYEPFTSAMHGVVKDFRLPVNELGYFVTRIEEEHLWESKQLGAHSPQVLLNTLVYFNTKYFMLKTMDDHAKLSFTHIMKHWKKGNTLTPAGPKTSSNSPGSQGRSVLLRYYPPPNKVGNRHDERKCYEQHENPETPLRCPVKLYEFYLSKCPEASKSRSDMFYLQPERSCVPDSPVWYSTSALPGPQLDKMLQRIIMVREVQEHMLADAS